MQKLVKITNQLGRRILLDQDLQDSRLCRGHRCSLVYLTNTINSKCIIQLLKIILLDILKLVKIVDTSWANWANRAWTTWVTVLARGTWIAILTRCTVQTRGTLNFKMI